VWSKKRGLSSCATAHRPRAEEVGRPASPRAISGPARPARRIQAPRLSNPCVASRQRTANERLGGAANGRRSLQTSHVGRHRDRRCSRTVRGGEPPRRRQAYARRTLRREVLRSTPSAHVAVVSPAGYSRKRAPSRTERRLRSNACTRPQRFTALTRPARHRATVHDASRDAPTRERRWHGSPRWRHLTVM
jgi:hypothetical protein